MDLDFWSELLNPAEPQIKPVVATNAVAVGACGSVLPEMAVHAAIDITSNHDGADVSFTQESSGDMRLRRRNQAAGSVLVQAEPHAWSGARFGGG